MPKRDADHMLAQRTRILRAALTCIAGRGLEGTSVAEICRKAGLSAGALYIHFRSRDDILEAVMRHAVGRERRYPDDWPAFKASVLDIEVEDGLDIVTIAQARLHLQAESMRPGGLHDAYRPLLARSLAAMTHHLQAMQEAGRVRLRFSAERTALNISAYVDGMLWIALAAERSLDQLRPDLLDGLDALVITDRK